MPRTAHQNAKIENLEADLVTIEKLIAQAHHKAALISDLINYEVVAARLADASVEVKIARHSL